MGIAIIERAELSQQLAKLLSSEHELFAAEVASGLPITQAAVNAGFCAGYADELLAKEPIRQRVHELLLQRARDGFPPRTWIEAQMVMIVREALHGTDGKTLLDADGKPVAVPFRVPNHALALTALNSLAKLKGYVVDKSQKLSAKVDLTSMSPTQLRELFSQHLNDLSPGAQAKLKALLTTPDEDDEPVTYTAIPAAGNES